MRELAVVLRAAVHVRPDVEEDALAVESRQHRREGRPVDPLDDAHDHLRDDHRGARVPRREHALRAPVSHAFGRDPDGRAALLSDRGDRGLVEEDDLVRIDDADAAPVVGDLAELGLDLPPPADEERVETEIHGRRDRALHVDAGGVVAPHGVDGDRQVRPSRLRS